MSFWMYNKVGNYVKYDKIEKRITKIRNQKKLWKIANKALITDFRLHALDNLYDPNLLYSIGSTNSSGEVRFKAAGKLRNKSRAQEIYAGIAKNTETKGESYYSDEVELRMKAAEKITDKALAQKTYYDIAKNHHYYNQYVGEAIEKLTEPNLVFELILNDEYGNRYSGKLEIISDRNALIYIAKHAKSLDTRIDIIERLQDPVLAQEIYAEIAKNGESVGMRMTAAERLKDEDIAQEVYEDIAKEGGYYSERIEAIKKLKNQIVLADIAENDRDTSICCHAFERLYQIGYLQDEEIDRFVVSIINKSADSAYQLSKIPGLDKNLKIEEYSWDETITGDYYDMTVTNTAISKIYYKDKLIYDKDRKV